MTTRVNNIRYGIWGKRSHSAAKEDLVTYVEIDWSNEAVTALLSYVVPCEGACERDDFAPAQLVTEDTIL